jgi:hypothetical protein
MMQTNEIEAIKSLLATPKKIGIIPHRNPDGDVDFESHINNARNPIHPKGVVTK